MNCPICSGIKIEFYVAKNNFNLYRCRDCELIFVYPFMKDLGAIYGKDYFVGTSKGKIGYVNYDEDKKAMENTFQEYLKEIEKICPQKGGLFDVGTATGFFLKLAQKEGWKASGSDISGYAAAEARQQNLKVETGQLKSLNLSSDYFDVVTLWDTFEHLDNPKYNLEIIYRILKKGGLLALNTPDTNSLFARILGKKWHLFVPPEHLFYFNPKNLSFLLKNTGFETVLVRKIGKSFTLQYIFQILSRWQNSSGWDRLTQYFKNTKIGRLSFPINLRDNFFLIAKKI